MQFKTTVGGGVEVADPVGMSGKPKEGVTVEDGMTFRTTNGPEQGVQPHPRSQVQPDMGGTEDARRKVAKAICSDFPTTYDFGQPAKKKLARLQADFEDRPDVIRAVFAAESDDMKAKLVNEFPQVFEG
jgi:hypothetical protein